MRRRTFQIILIATAIALAILFAGGDLLRGFKLLGNLNLASVISGGLLLLATAAGLLAHLRMHKGVELLTEALKNCNEEQNLELATVNVCPELHELSRAIRIAIKTFPAGSESAPCRIRELEARLKLAELERDHAQCISADIAGALPEPDESAPHTQISEVAQATRVITTNRDLNALKNDFVSSVSHELRTPLASIKAYIEMLIDGEADSDETKREFYDVIQTEANRLSRLIDTILSVSRLESGLARVNRVPRNLNQTIQEAVESIRASAGAKNIAIQQELTTEPYQTLADSEMMHQAVVNLLSNSVKFTSINGQIWVQSLIDRDRNALLVRITDTGLGISPKDLPFVFDKFFKGTNSEAPQGAGLGLALVKQVAEAHQGRVSAESQVGEGSCFEIELPLCENAEAAAAVVGDSHE